MRARLAAALMTDPLVLVLDEPFEGIDRASADVIRAVSRGFTAGGGAVLCTASSASSLEVLCDHIGELADGRLTTFRPVRRHRPAVRSRARRARAGAGVAGKWRHGGCA
ncbi:MAG TPA: hypothetical protein VFG87_12355 [Amycolatopsis sp.]|jgi:ABC-type multidrug transport system ATPase subunit|nr:hypothetical protein [Amycolatopsis sp.]